MKKQNLLGAGLLSLLLLGTTSCTSQKKVADTEPEPYSSYLFAFFSNNSPDGEQIRYALSDDGFNYQSLNEGRPVVASDTIALKKSIRDPYITRSQDGKTYYMVMTDMRSDEGWQSNDGLILMKSNDLIHWQHKAIDFPTRFPNLEGFDKDNLHAVWAPQIIWDDQAKKYMIYYSIGRHDWEYPTEDPNFNQPYFKIFYSYVNDDFTDVTEPKLLFDFGKAAIDGDIVYSPTEQKYVLFFKDEGRSVMNGDFRTMQGVMRATSKNLTGPYEIEWRHLNKEGQYPVEGSSVFKLIDKDEYVLMYDCYAEGYYQFCKSSDLKNFTFVQNTKTEGTFTPRHGSVMHITATERAMLEAWSALQIALNRVNGLEGLTEEEVGQRTALVEKAQQILNAACDTQAYLDMAKELDGFKK
ncbi:glycoside hydrolase family 43 protein [uncultured Bacteroides sp.]|uniref:glycoside hydrolase family 43 protein n=1 Tax=uncultured Bacteroides sp. TaxID=162156 RepID=UPI002606FC82|nr:glycoside hydrolase family 43 protein [uncultured Bacteroides sp.]